MTLDELEKYLNQKENERLEYKESKKNLTRVLLKQCAPSLTKKED